MHANRNYKVSNYIPSNHIVKDEHVHTKFRVYICDKCDKVWQIGANERLEYLTDFPRYKLEHKDCSACKT